MMWFTQGLVLWLALAAVFTLGGLVASLAIGHQRIAPTATSVPLDEQDYTVLLSLCEEAMLDEPYTNRAVYLARLIDILEERLLQL